MPLALAALLSSACAASLPAPPTAERVDLLVQPDLVGLRFDRLRNPNPYPITVCVRHALIYGGGDLAASPPACEVEHLGPCVVLGPDVTAGEVTFVARVTCPLHPAEGGAQVFADLVVNTTRGVEPSQQVFTMLGQVDVRAVRP